MLVVRVRLRPWTLSLRLGERSRHSAGSARSVVSLCATPHWFCG